MIQKGSIHNGQESIAAGRYCSNARSREPRDHISIPYRNRREQELG